MKKSKSPSKVLKFIWKYRKYIAQAAPYIYNGIKLIIKKIKDGKRKRNLNKRTGKEIG